MSKMIGKVGVLGAGQMGRGIAQVAAQCKRDVLLADLSVDQAQKGKDIIDKVLRKLVDKGKIDDTARGQVLERIHPVGALADLGSAELVVEAATENAELKCELFRKLDDAASPESVIASNTSSISITQLAAVTKRPQQVIGMHFMNPVPVMKLVEVIRGVETSDETYKTTCTLAEELGKTVVTSNDYPGFIVNRILMPMINEAVYALMEGVATVQDIDAAMTLGTNQPMGPLSLADFIGLDTCLAILDVMHNDLGDPKYRPCPLLRRYVQSGRLGRKSGRGFHTY